jgi:hypothetical protein
MNFRRKPNGKYTTAGLDRQGETEQPPWQRENLPDYAARF